MNILYGVSGEGYGHATRTIEFVNALEKNGHKVIIFSYDRAYEVLKKKFNVVEVNGMNLIYKKGKLNYTKSAFSILNKYPRNIFKIFKFHKLLKTFNPDICITDMEPIVPILSYIYKIPLISISNQNTLTRYKIDYPSKYRGSYFVAKSAINFIVPKADKYIALSIIKLNKPKANTLIASAPIREDIRNVKPKYKDYIIVYLSKENNPVLEILKEINQKFIVYGLDVKKKDKNLQFKKKDSFLKDFINCNAIISTSGFTSLSESIHLKKPYLAIPLKGQFEQIYNALLIRKLGFGDFSESLTKEEVESFISNIPKFKKNLQTYRSNLKDPVSVLLKLIRTIK